MPVTEVRMVAGSESRIQLWIKSCGALFSDTG